MNEVIGSDQAGLEARHTRGAWVSWRLREKKKTI
jgi:hypothetical protein